MADTGIPTHAVGRLLHDLTVAPAKDLKKQADFERSVGLREIDLQFQVEIKGEATATPAFEEVTIHFDYGLFYAPGQRESNLEEPHFTYGSHTKPAVGVFATVVEWLKHEKNGSIVGVVIAIGVIGEGTFKGKVHLTFQGFGALLEEYGSEAEEQLATEG